MCVCSIHVHMCVVCTVCGQYVCAVYMYGACEGRVVECVCVVYMYVVYVYSVCGVVVCM